MNFQFYNLKTMRCVIYVQTSLKQNMKHVFNILRFIYGLSDREKEIQRSNPEMSYTTTVTSVDLNIREKS